MSKTRERTLLFFILVISSALAQDEGVSVERDLSLNNIDLCDSCNSQRTGAAGTCIKMGACPQAIADLRKGLSPQICTFSGSIPVVCCAQGNPSPVATTTTTTTTPRSVGSSSAEEGCPPLPDKALKVSKTGQKSWDFCVDLANTIFRCKRSLLIGGPREREELCSHYVESLVVGGVPAGVNEFPHMALLGYGDLDRALWECGGTLISNRWVLTAAHCLYSRSAGTDVKFVRLGSPEVSARIDRSKLFTITQIVEHPIHAESTPPQIYSDIALLKLDRAVSFGPSIIPACLDFGSTNVQKAVITGWGVTKSKGVQSNVLQKVTLEQFPHETCSPAHPVTVRAPQGVVNETQICYGSKKEVKDSCQGDSGGPLQIQNRDVYCTYTVIGVVSVGKGCANVGIPGIYTRVAAYVPWIESIVWP